MVVAWSMRAAATPTPQGILQGAARPIGLAGLETTARHQILDAGRAARRAQVDHAVGCGPQEGARAKSIVGEADHPSSEPRTFWCFSASWRLRSAIRFAYSSSSFRSRSFSSRRLDFLVVTIRRVVRRLVASLLPLSCHRRERTKSQQKVQVQSRAKGQEA
jgi:hypothetical protein